MEKLHILRQQLKAYNKLCIGFSGGVDSTFLLKIASEELGDNCFAIIADGPMLPRRELAEAIALAKEIGVSYEVIQIDAMAVEQFAANDRKRCYYCKKNIFSRIKEIADELGAQVADGKNVDDVSPDIYRPGQQATQELGIVSPLFDAGLTKDDIRIYSRLLGVRTWGKPSNSCLATRIPYDEPVTIEKLGIIEAAENYLQDGGIKGMRVRLHKDLIRVEVPPEHLGMWLTNKEAIAYFKSLGIKYITLDMEGYRSGSMD